MTQNERPRRACVLIPLFSLRRPGGWGVGDISDIPRFARWARSAGFSVVQLLPVNEVCGGETSPYAAASAFALDPVYLGLDDCEDFQRAGGRNALSPEDRALIEELERAPRVDWARARPLKLRASGLAFQRFLRDEWAARSDRAWELVRFRLEQAGWLEDYALFSVLHDRFQKSWLDWPEPLRERHPRALAGVRKEHEQALLFRAWAQWQLDLQWRKARAEAQAAGVELMGDLPFVVSGDSADVWSRPEAFRVDLRVGTPPDDFSADGQDWGLPAYDWTALARSSYGWIRARAARSGELYALYRVDHVIGLYRTYTRSADGEAGFMPVEEEDQIALGEALIRIMSESGEVVAEDLGMVPEFLRPSLTRLGVPGYKVFRWEKDGGTYHDPATWTPLSVAASGTHDITSNAEWYDELSEEERKALAAVPGLEALPEHPRFDDFVRDALLRVVYAAPSELVAVPFQDALGTRERVNVPGTVSETNWTYRMGMTLAALEADASTAGRLAELARQTGR